MYRTTVKNHIMIAHSFNDKCFGEAANLHGATYIIEAEFSSKDLTKNMVINIDHAMEALTAVSNRLNYKNLDELEEFKGKLTTTEFIAHWIHQEISTIIKDHFSGGIKITLHESHVASASYEGPSHIL